MRPRVVELHGKKVLVLNGLTTAESGTKSSDAEALDKLVEAIAKNPDAVAFGCISGKWVAAA